MAKIQDGVKPDIFKCAESLSAYSDNIYMVTSPDRVGAVAIVQEELRVHACIKIQRMFDFGPIRLRPENSNVHISGPRRFKHHQNSVMPAFGQTAFGQF